MDSDGAIKEWYEKKMEGLTAYSLVKDKMPKRTRRILQLHFDQGIPLDKIGFELCLSGSQGTEEGIQEAMDCQNQCRFARTGSDLQPAHGRLEKGQCRD